MSGSRPVRVLYSFPHRLGAARICTTAWYQVKGLAAAGADLIVAPGSVVRPLPPEVKIRPTLAFGGLRIPYRAVGRMRAFAWHDYMVAKRLEGLKDKVDIVHVWPLGALRTLKTAARLGIPAVLERPNAHTRFAYEVVRRECERIGVPLPSGHEHEYNAEVLRMEEEEYSLATKLLCPSDFVASTFQDLGFTPDRLARHHYGFDEKVFFPEPGWTAEGRGLRVLFAGGCAPRKGLHYALEAWLRSPAHESGVFTIAGGFIPGYAEKLSPMLSHPSVRNLGHRSDIPQLMRGSDVLILPSIEEGHALVTAEATGSGCVLVVSEGAGAVCTHNVNALVHAVGDVDTLTNHLTMLHQDRALLMRLRKASLATAHEITWDAAGARLLQVYQEVLAEKEPASLGNSTRQSQSAG